MTSRRGRTAKQDFRQEFRSLCRTLCIDALNAANYSENRHYADMVENTERCVRTSAALNKAAKKFREMTRKTAKPKPKPKKTSGRRKR